MEVQKRCVFPVFVYVGILVIKVCYGGVIPDRDVDESWDAVTLWPEGRVPYRIPPGAYGKFDEGVLLAAMKRWEEQTCVKFVPWTESMEQELGRKQYVEFFSQGSCFSKTGVHHIQPQLLGIGKRCLKLPTVIHELGHTLGMVHEMERVDRDWYIYVNYTNLNPDSAANYATTASRNLQYPLYNTPYDYKSIMHYGPKAWSSNGDVVIVTKDPAYQNIIGKNNDVSFFDAMYINRAYNCSAKCSRSLAGLCRNGGFLGGPNCQCVCQDGFSGLFCDQPLTGYETIIQWQCQKNWNFHAGKCFRFQTDYIVDYTSARDYCTSRNASLYVMKTRPEIEWIIKRTVEQALMTTVESFWIGLKTTKDEQNMKWDDGSFVDMNLVSVIDRAKNEETKCAQFDGESVVLTTCDSHPDNGFICVKDFDASCGGRYRVTAQNITIQSPGFPKAYPEDTECTYILQADEKARVSLTFMNFQMDSNCRKDFVEVKLQKDILQTGRRYCGSQLNGMTVTSEANVLIVRMKTDFRGSAPGFQATASEIQSVTRTTPNPFTVLDTILNVFDKANGRQTNQQQRWSLKGLFDIVKSFAFARLI